MKWLRAGVLLAIAISAVGAGWCEDGPDESKSVRLERPGEYTRHELRLPGVLRDGNDLMLSLGVQDGRIRQAWAVAPAHGIAGRQVETDELRLDGNTLKGPARVSVSYPGEGRVFLLDLDFDARLRDGTWSGSVHSRHAQRGPLVIDSDKLVVQPGELKWSLVGGQVLRGEVTGSAEARARAKGTVVATMETDQLVYVHARVARWGKAKIVLTFKDGKLVDSSFGPRKFDKWKATVSKAEATITDDKLRAQLVVDVSGDAVRGGRHVVKIDGDLVGNTIAGEADSFQDNKRVNRFRNMLGKLRRTDAPARPDSTVVTVTMPKAVAGKTTPKLVLTIEGQKIVAGAVRGYLRELGKVDYSGLDVGDGRITGKATLHFPTGSALVSDEDAQATYELDLKIDDGKVTGTYAGRWGEVHEVRAKLAGVARSQAELRKDYAIPSRYDWPCWSGPNQNLTADTSGEELVSRLSDAKLLWCSERTLPGRCQVDRYGESNLDKWKRSGAASGGGTPILYDGKVYFYYVRPGDGEPDKGIMEGFRKKGKRTMALLWALRADEVMLCLDAATGQTLWKSVMPNSGRYGAGKGKRGGYTAWMCGGQGRVFVTGVDGQLRCLDADTGELQWSVRNGRGEVAQVIDGILVTPGSKKGAGDLRGIDVRNGRELWAVENGCSTFAQPLKWVHKGKTWIIANDRGGSVRCVDPASGKVRWTIPAMGEENSTTMSIGGDVLIVEAEREKAPKDVPARRVDDPIVRKEGIERVMVAFRMSDSQAKPIWVLDERYHANRTAPPYRDGVFYYRNVTTKKVYALDAETGKILSRAVSDSVGTLELMGDRLLVLRDPSHGHTEFDWFGLDEEGGITTLETNWHSMNLPTTGYWPIVGSHAMADGRLILRGARGIFCYDLRAKKE